jgi:hypothetical protein
MEPPTNVFGYPAAVEKGHGVVLAAAGQEGIWILLEGSGIVVREELQRLLPWRPGCVDEVVGGAPYCDGQEDKGGLGANE